MKMFNLSVKELTVGVTFTLTLLASSSVFATETAVIALYPNADEAASMKSDIESQGLMNCKQLVQEAFGVIVVQLECNTLSDIKVALATDIFPVATMSSSTLWIKPTKE